MMQAFLILPVMAVVYLLAAPTGWWRRVWQTFLMGISVLVAAGWWVAIVALTPAADRPYVGGSQNNSILNLIFGYNGFGRITGNESGSVGGGRVSGSMWGPTGVTRLFNAEFGNMMSWLLPGALVMGAVLLVVTLRARRTDRERAALLLWGGSLVSIGLVISLAQGIIHPYYTVALAPPLGALVGIATIGLWQRRATWVGRLGLAAGLAATVVWTYLLLGRTSDWFPALRPFVVVVGALGVVAILALPLLRDLPKLAVALVAVLGFGAALAAPLFSTVATAATPHTGAIPTVTPTPAGGQGGPGGGGFPRRLRGRRSAAPSEAVASPAARRAVGFPGGGFRARAGAGAGAGTGTGGFPGGARPFGAGGAFRRGAGAAGPGGAGFLSSSASNPALTKALQADAGRYTWAAATVNSNNAAGYQLASRRARDGHRRVQRDGPRTDAGRVREGRLGRQDPLLHRQRRRGASAVAASAVERELRRRVADHLVGGGALHRRDVRRCDRLQPHDRRLVLTGDEPSRSAEELEVARQGGAVEGDESDEGHVGVRRAGGGHGDLGGLPQGIAVDTGRDGGKGDRTGADLVGHGQRVPVAGGQRLGLALRPAVPDRPDSVDDEAGGQVEPVGDHGLPGRALADGPAGGQQALGAGGAMDGSVDAPAPRSRRLAAFDDGVHPLGGDVALHGLEHRRHRAAYPPVVDDEVGGTSFSNDTVGEGAVWLLFSPQFVNETVPRMADEPPAPPALVTSLIGSGEPLDGT